MTFTDYFNNVVCNISALLRIYNVTFLHLKKAANTTVNKTALQRNAYCLLANHSVSVSTRGQHWEGLAGERVSVYRVVAGGCLPVQWGTMHHGWCSHSTLPLWTDRHTRLKTLPSRNFVYMNSFVRLRGKNTMTLYVTVTTRARMMSSDLMVSSPDQYWELKIILGDGRSTVNGYVTGIDCF